MANPRKSQSYQSCCLCSIGEAVKLCPCQDTPQLFCDSCVHKHFAESRSSCHPILPIDSLPFYKLPGYIEQYRERTGIKYEVALKALRGNLGEIDRWKFAVIDSTATIVKLLTDHSDNVVAALEALKVKLGDAITEGVREAEEAVFEPSPVLNSRIARGLRNCEEMGLVTFQTDIAEVTRQFEELVKTYVVLIQVEVPGCVSIEQPRGEEIRAVVISEKSLDRAGNVSEPYIGERDDKSRKNGYGKISLVDGTAIETHWKCDKPRGIGKCSSTSHSFFVGDCNEYLNRNRQKSKRWIGVVLLGVIVAMAVGRGNDDCELRSRGSTETETGMYTGQWNVQNEFHGFGMMRYSDSDVSIYESHWVNGMKNGKGKETYKDGSEYEGDFASGMKQGYGVHINSATNYTYLGTWKRNLKHGIGYESNKTETGEETVYIGEFVEGKRTGKGVSYVDWSAANTTQINSSYSAANISLYRAYVVNGEKAGMGLIMYTDGSIYVGGVINVMKDGYGVYKSGVENSTYVGFWGNDLKDMSGIEVNVTKEGERKVYIGFFVKGERSGKGVQYVNWNAANETHVNSIYSAANILSYQAYWVNGNEIGKGLIEYTDGSKYEGEVINVMKHGYGVYIHDVHNSTYIGIWEKDLKDKLGIEMNDAEGGHNMYIGLFDKGKRDVKGVQFVEWSAEQVTLVNSYYASVNISSYSAFHVNGEETGKGTIVYTDGSLYNGGVINGLKNGFGIYKSYVDNSTYIGIWEHDLKNDFGSEFTDTQEGERSMYIGGFLKGKRGGKGVRFAIWNAEKETQVDSRYSAGNISSYHASQVNDEVCSGIITYRDGSHYKGELLNERRHGLGAYTSGVDNSSYVGIWENDFRHTFGMQVKYTEDGERNAYLGEYIQGEQTEKGVHYVEWNVNKKTLVESRYSAANIISYQAFWVVDKVSKGKITYKDGSVYTGGVLKERRHGYGVYMTESDISYSGTWVNNLKDGVGMEIITMTEGKSTWYFGEFVGGKRKERVQPSQTTILCL